MVLETEPANKGLFDQCRNDICSQCNAATKKMCCSQAMQAYHGVRQ